MKRLPLYVMLLLILAACVEKKTDSGRIAARSLYQQSEDILSKYTDSVRNARDSASLLGIMERLDIALTDCEFTYPPETDLRMSEGENATLANLALRISFLRDSLFYVYAHPVIPADSIPADSVAVNSSSPAVPAKAPAKQ